MFPLAGVTDEVVGDYTLPAVSPAIFPAGKARRTLLLSPWIRLPYFLMNFNTTQLNHKEANLSFLFFLSYTILLGLVLIFFSLFSLKLNI